MEIRFFAWAGYDLLGPVEGGLGVMPTPEVEGSSVAKTTMISRELSPSLKGRFRTQTSVRVFHDDLRPFPSPKNT